jgi:hypothetical protein
MFDADTTFGLTNYASQVQPVTASTVPATGLNTVVHGVTVHSRLQKCRPLDQFIFTASNDLLTLVYNDECIVGLSGNMTVQEYNAFVLGMRWRTASPFLRGVLDFAFVYLTCARCLWIWTTAGSTRRSTPLSCLCWGQAGRWSRCSRLSGASAGRRDHPDLPCYRRSAVDARQRLADDFLRLGAARA